MVTTGVFEAVDQVRHVSLARQAKVLIIAPATADLISRIAAGRADDLLTNIVLATTAPVVIVPAMHPAMWFNQATQQNVETLRRRGYAVMEPSEGALTSGDVGKGRFPTTEEIIDFYQRVTAPQDLLGKRVLISAGGTREAIDPVRFIGNKSSGRQGVALAEAARLRGASVTLVIANSEIPTHHDIKRLDVESVAQMQIALEANFPESDYLFMSAAISDVRPAQVSTAKIKKGSLGEIPLVENPDVLSGLTANKSHQVVVAFAAETEENAESEALSKLERKRADLIFLNNVSSGAIFGSTNTSGKILDNSGVIESTGEISKEKLANILINHAISISHKLG